MRITFLVRNIWGLGGTIKTTLNTATALVESGHEVTIASCVRHKTESDFVLDDRINIVNLLDVRPRDEGGEIFTRAEEKLAAKPSVIDAGAKALNMSEASRLLDRRVKRYLRKIQTDVVVGTHTGTNLYVAKYARSATARVAQEHMCFDRYKEPVQAKITRNYTKLDAVVTVTEADAKAYRKALSGTRSEILCIPNSVPAMAVSSKTQPDKAIVSVGRLTDVKGFDILIRAFSKIAHDYPEWELRIYGRGPKRGKLLGIIEELGLEDRVSLMGPVTPIDPELAKASIAVVASRFESFGLSIIEAMGAGLPLVCTAVRQGPLELVDDEVNGLLVKPKSPTEMAKAISRLIEDRGLRSKLSEGGVRTAWGYEPTQVVHHHIALFERLIK